MRSPRSERFRWPSRRLLAVAVLLVVVSAPLGVGMFTTLAAATAPSPSVHGMEQPCVGGAMQVIAHPDDDLLFQNPDVLHDVDAGRCVRTLVLTAGDAGRGESYWSAREAGLLAAYADMAGVADRWRVASAGLPDDPLEVHSLVAAPNVSVVFLRLPDGGRTGQGFAAQGYQSLAALWRGDLGSITSVDGVRTLTSSTLVDLLARLVDAFGPTTVRTLDWTIAFGRGDSADHTATGLFAREADLQVQTGHTLLAYAGYPSWTRTPNVPLSDQRMRAAVLGAYARHDAEMCLHPWCGVAFAASFRLGRQYVVASQSDTDLARAPGVRVRASSEQRRDGQTADKVIDGLVGGTSRPASTQWRSAGERAGAWVQVELAGPESVGAVVLAGRLDPAEQILRAQVLFSDGSSVEVGPLPANGSPLTVTFARRVTDSVRLVVQEVGPTTTAVGLAEISVYQHVATQGGAGT